MRRVGRLILGTFIRGVLFLVPIVLIAILAREAYSLLHRAFQPVARLFPPERVAGLLVEDLLSLLVLVLVFLIAGLFVGTRPGRTLSNRLEQAVLYRVPGYLMVRGLVGGLEGFHANADARPQPALIETDEGWAFGLLVERLPCDFCTVFLPDAPTPTSGSVRIVTATRVHPLDISMFALLGMLTRSGAGAGALAAPVLAGTQRQAADNPSPPASPPS